MNRRTFLQRTALLGAAGWLARSPLFAQTAALQGPADAFRPLRRNVGYFTGRGGTIGWLVNADALAIVDTQFPETATQCRDGLPGRDGRMIDVVLNTHHHRDHTSGNGVFKEAARTIVAHANVPRLQRAGVENPDAVVVADETFETSWRRELGDEVVTATYFGAAHTSGDAIIHFENANVVHMGDLTFNRLYPYIDRPAGADIRHWITVLETAVKTYPKDAIYVFGHGSARFGVEGTQDDLLVFRDYLSGLLDYVGRRIAAGDLRESIVAIENLPGFPDFHQPLPNRLGLNLGVAYDELTDEG
jgi:glyoxylase-like metal-dependent hydrolase (beta-lactamase superfamily II)